MPESTDPPEPVPSPPTRCDGNPFIKPYAVRYEEQDDVSNKRGAAHDNKQTNDIVSDDNAIQPYAVAYTCQEEMSSFNNAPDETQNNDPFEERRGAPKKTNGTPDTSVVGSGPIRSDDASVSTRDDSIPQNIIHPNPSNGTGPNPIAAPIALNPNPMYVANGQQRYCGFSFRCVGISALTITLLALLIFGGTFAVLYFKQDTENLHKPTATVSSANATGQPTIDTTYTTGQSAIDTTYSSGQSPIDTTYTTGQHAMNTASSTGQYAFDTSYSTGQSVSGYSERASLTKFATTSTNLEETSSEVPPPFPMPQAPIKKWRKDHHCGQGYPAEDGHPAQCDPDGLFPCCSSGNWCGISPDHCNCAACVDYRNPVSPAEPAAIITVAVLAIVGNLLVVVVTTRRQTFPSASRLFVFSLAWSDFLLGSTFPFLVAPARAGHWVYSDTAVQAMAVIQFSCLTIRLPSLAGLNFDRHYALLNGGEGISCKKALIFLTVTWTGIFTWFIVSTISGVTAVYDPVIARPDYNFKAHKWFSAVSFGISYISLAVTIYCVVRILRTLCTHHQQPPPAAQVPAIVVINVNGVNPQNANPQQAENHHSNRAFAKIVLRLTLVQILTLLLAGSSLVLRQLGYDMPTYLFWSNWIALFNTFLDVVVYSVCQQSFYIAIVEIAVSIVLALYNACCRTNRVDLDPVNRNG
uniref:G-protein coupled receptors family 1 profile domain-containing protein n=1 Tax=Branchiostoma floridae TaxID=7739 RepID=C3ZRV4_BRAFL|eukprot:XP_002588743.1 hypothetical protein BRAFLDRAFT_100180 [Branchiostoma floridae]